MCTNTYPRLYHRCCSRAFVISWGHIKRSGAYVSTLDRAENRTSTPSMPGFGSSARMIRFLSDGLKFPPICTCPPPSLRDYLSVIRSATRVHLSHAGDKPYRHHQQTLGSCDSICLVLVAYQCNHCRSIPFI